MPSPATETTRYIAPGPSLNQSVTVPPCLFSTTHMLRRQMILLPSPNLTNHKASIPFSSTVHEANLPGQISPPPASLSYVQHHNYDKDLFPSTSIGCNPSIPSSIPLSPTILPSHNHPPSNDAAASSPPPPWDLPVATRSLLSYPRKANGQLKL